MGTKRWKDTQTFKLFGSQQIRRLLISSLPGYILLNGVYNFQIAGGNCYRLREMLTIFDQLPTMEESIIGGQFAGFNTGKMLCFLG